MARAGQTLEGVATAITFMETAADTGGERVTVEIAYRAGSGRPPAHFHPSQTERFEVLDGEILALVDGTEHALHRGDELVIPPGTVHEMWSPKGGRQRWTTSPALGTERFFETVWGLQADGKTDGSGVPSKLQMALTLRRFSDEFRLASPPAAVQAVVLPALAAIARARGLEPEYRPA